MSQPISNMDRFNLTALTLFSDLYDSFPIPKDIEAQALGATASPEEGSDVDHWKFMALSADAITWLNEEGFIRYEGLRFGSTFRNVRLTLRGLTILGFVPSAVKTDVTPETMISKVKRTIAAGAEKAGTEAVKAVLGELFRLAYSPSTAHAVSALVQV